MSTEEKLSDCSELHYGEDYLSWKDWGSSSFGKLSAMDCKYFSCEIDRAKRSFDANSTVLEIGFGNGSFLQFAKTKGWEISGTELNENLVKIAAENQFNVFHTENLTAFENTSYDLVVAFDVLEHIPQDKILLFLSEIKRILKPNGCFIARFPNGDSPFGLSHQNGDVTHVTFIGSGKIKYFVSKLDVELVTVGGEARPFFLTLNPFLFLARAFKRITVQLISYFYYKVFCKPDYFSSNLVMIFKKI
ncbi:MAG: class I SAM-dependent methyltransferase [Pseudomonadota bacterium]